MLHALRFPPLLHLNAWQMQFSSSYFDWQFVERWFFLGILNYLVFLLLLWFLLSWGDFSRMISHHLLLLIRSQDICSITLKYVNQKLEVTLRILEDFFEKRLYLKKEWCVHISKKLSEFPLNTSNNSFFKSQVIRFLFNNNIPI